MDLQLNKLYESKGNEYLNSSLPDRVSGFPCSLWHWSCWCSLYLLAEMLTEWWAGASLFPTQGREVGGLTSASGQAFASWRLANTTAQDFSFSPESYFLNIYHTAQIFIFFFFWMTISCENRMWPFGEKRGREDFSIMSKLERGM